MKKTAITLCALFLLTLALPAFPSGWDNSLMGTRAAGMASAFAGLADDATAVFYNPAGLAFTDDKGEITLVGKQYYPKHYYTNPQGQESISRNPTFLPELFTYYRVSDRWTLGFGAYTPYAGGGIEWKEEQVGFHLDGAIYVTSLSPTVAVKITDWISFGANLNGYFAKTDQKYENAADPLAVFNSDEDDFNLSYSAALFVKPGDTWSAGLTYHARSKMALTGTTELDFFDEKYDSDTKFTLPSWFALGGAWHATEKLTFTAEWDYFNWTTMDSLEKTIHDTPVGDFAQEEMLGFKNAYYLQFGSEYTISDAWDIRFGASYEKGAVQPEYLSLTNMDASKTHLFTGFSYHWRSYNFDMAGFYSMGQEQTVGEDDIIEGRFNLPGTYNIDASGILFSVSRTF